MLDVEKILEEIRRLHQLREHLLASELAPKGAWIHEYDVVRHYPSGFIGIYRYAKWQSPTPIFKRNPKKRGKKPGKGKDQNYTCHQHIGRVGSDTGLGTEPEVEAAYRAWYNRQRLEEIESAIEEIEKILLKFQSGE